jgi:hypothetical protein
VIVIIIARISRNKLTFSRVVGGFEKWVTEAGERIKVKDERCLKRGAWQLADG